MDDQGGQVKIKSQIIGVWNMKKLFIIFLTGIFITGCSANGDDNKVEEEADQASEAVNDDQQDEESDDDAGNEEDGADSDKDKDAKGAFESEEEYQLDLKMGDTGSIHSTVGKYDITLNSSEIKEEIDGQSPELEQLVILDVTVKNTSDSALELTDILDTFDLTDDMEFSGYGNVSHLYEGLEELSGEIDVDEEVTGQMVMNAYDSDVYYFRENPGVVEAGLSNEVVWTIEESDMEY